MTDEVIPLDTLVKVHRKIKMQIDELTQEYDNKVETLKQYYKDKGLFEKSILSKDFIIYNQKVIDRIKVYSYLFLLVKYFFS
jgi:DNA integrity scanning protein DisA with diadenylate cyclase activity